jgi:hypothetical protein
MRMKKEMLRRMRMEKGMTQVRMTMRKAARMKKRTSSSRSRS